MQLQEECTNMDVNNSESEQINENKNNIVIIEFKNELKKMELNLESPDFSKIIKEIIENNLSVVDENVFIYYKSTNSKDDIDLNAIKSILIESHKKYSDEISKFFKNIENDIETYYSDENDIKESIINKIKSENNNID